MNYDGFLDWGQGVINGFAQLGNWLISPLTKIGNFSVTPLLLMSSAGLLIFIAAAVVKWVVS